jgi:hypothetical protein
MGFLIAIDLFLRHCFDQGDDSAPSDRFTEQKCADGYTIHPSRALEQSRQPAKTAIVCFKPGPVLQTKTLI